MSTGAGLSRRRGAPAGVNSSLNDDDELRTISPAPGSSSAAAASGSKATSAASASASAAANGSSQRAGGGTFEGRGKVAYDPRDFEDKDEKEGVPRLTLLEEILLLGLKDNQVGPPSLGLAGCSCIRYSTVRNCYRRPRLEEGTESDGEGRRGTGAGETLRGPVAQLGSSCIQRAPEHGRRRSPLAA